MGIAVSSLFSVRPFLKGKTRKYKCLVIAATKRDSLGLPKVTTLKHPIDLLEDLALKPSNFTLVI